MLFNSQQFLIFYLIVIVLYYTLHHKLILPLLLSASCVFYCFFIPKYLLILIFVIGIDYTAGLLIEKYWDKRKLFLLLSICSNLGVLFIFKYFNFFIINSNAHFGTNFLLLKYILPIGLSFHTFQSLSYIIEVYRGKIKAEHHLGYFALYVLYFPQLVAGPIERPQNVLHQLKEKHKLDWQNILDGGRLILWGLFKKVVIADRISYYVNGIFNHTNQYSPIQICVGILFFSIQIYCDFSGYSDMAIGISQTFGIRLMTNFNRPYLAKNIQEFWQRWHISLSTWFRDYVYYPLGGSKFGYSRTIVNLFIVFILSGIWHGAGWNFIIWGFIHAICISVFISIKKYLPQEKNLFSNLISVIITFFIVTICWVFFRANSLHNAIDVLQSATHFATNKSLNLLGSFDGLNFGMMNFGLVIAMIVFMFITEIKMDVLLLKLNNYKYLDIIWIVIIINIIVFTGIFSSQSFIYFQF